MLMYLNSHRHCHHNDYLDNHDDSDDDDDDDDDARQGRSLLVQPTIETQLISLVEQS